MLEAIFSLEMAPIGVQIFKASQYVVIIDAYFLVIGNTHAKETSWVLKEKIKHMPKNRSTTLPYVKEVVSLANIKVMDSWFKLLSLLPLDYMMIKKNLLVPKPPFGTSHVGRHKYNTVRRAKQQTRWICV